MDHGDIERYNSVDALGSRTNNNSKNRVCTQLGRQVCEWRGGELMILDVRLEARRLELALFVQDDVSFSLHSASFV